MNNITVSGSNIFLRERLASALAKESAEAETLIFCGREAELENVLRECSGRLIFLADAAESFSGRRALLEERYDEYETRFMLAEEQTVRGISEKGISEEFQPVRLPDNVILNRCCEIGGTGKSRAWLSAHVNGTDCLRYVSFGGSGKQVFDLLHVGDLVSLVREQIHAFRPGLYHVSGGVRASVSLLELTAVCESATGNIVKITNDESRREIPVFSLDISRLTEYFIWRPEYGVEEIVRDMLVRQVTDVS